MISQSQHSERSRRRRQPRNKAVFDCTTSNDETGPLDEASRNPSTYTTNHKKSDRAGAESVLANQIEEAGATTPPRNKSSQNKHVYDGNTPNGHNGQKNPRNKRNNASNETHMSTPGPKKAKPQQPGTTPSKPVIEAYAGPTFHASPAPSALPIPKFFSKSAPANDQDVGISARLQKEDIAGSDGSEEGPDSPLRKSSNKLYMTDKDASAPAAFNMLLNADREEKARHRASQDASPARNGSLGNGQQAHHPVAQRPKHHRTLTDSNVFPMDMDSNSGRSTPAAANAQPMHPARQDSPAYFNPSRPYTSSNDDHLKRMLFSSPPPPSANGHPQYAYNAGLDSSPAWSSSSASRMNGSPYGTPSSASSINGLAASSRPATASSYSQSSPSPVARRPNMQPHSNSGLRREVSPGKLDLQGTPPYLPAQPHAENYYPYNSSPLGSPIAQRFPVGPPKNHSPYGSHGYNSPARNHSPAGYQGIPTSKFASQDTLQASLGREPASTMNVTGMEDELRKILRISDLRATSTAAPPS